MSIFHNCCHYAFQYTLVWSSGIRLLLIHLTCMFFYTRDICCCCLDSYILVGCFLKCMLGRYKFIDDSNSGLVLLDLEYLFWIDSWCGIYYEYICCQLWGDTVYVVKDDVDWVMCIIDVVFILFVICGDFGVCLHFLLFCVLLTRHPNYYGCIISFLIKNVFTKIMHRKNK